jgi:DNA replication protein DnaC
VQSGEGVESVARCPDCQSELNRRRRLRQAEIPPRYFDRGFDVYSIHHATQEVALKKSIDWVESFPEVQRGLLFVGPCGVGKTHLSVAVLKTLVQEQRISGRFVDEAELLRRLQFSYGPDSPDTEREVLLPLMEVDLLVWDDLGTGRPTDWVKETIRMVINNRYTYRKPTVMSSNWPLKSASRTKWSGVASTEQSLPERIGARLFSRIMEMCDIVEIEGPDARAVIHKAGMDFQAHTSTGAELKVPSGLLRCPQCDSAQVRGLDQSDAKGVGVRSCVEISCLCGQCSEHFLVRFFPRTAKVEYPSYP